MATTSLYSLADVDGAKLRSSGDPTYAILDLEIDRGCGNKMFCDGEQGNIPLYKYHEVPPFLRSNPYVTQGYRAMLPPSLCMKSLFVWSNETINIWSHILGFSLFFYLMIYDNAIWIPEKHGSLADHFCLTLALTCFQFCLLCSAGYHLFLCHSEKACVRWLALDLTGISVALLGVYLPAIHYAFYCFSIWKDFYLVVISLLFGAVLIFQTQPKYYSHAWHRFRVLLYVGLVSYGIIPTVHWIHLSGGFTAHIVQVFLPRVAVMYGLGLLAFLFYFSKFPERFLPGKFDYLGSSHQWWHVIVVVTFYWWHDSGQIFLDYRLNNQCFVPK